MNTKILSSFLRDFCLLFSMLTLMMITSLAKAGCGIDPTGITIISPLANTTISGNNVPITYSITSNDPVNQITFTPSLFVDSNLVATLPNISVPPIVGTVTTFSTSLDSTTLTNGSHSILISAENVCNMLYLLNLFLLMFGTALPTHV